MDHHKTKSCVSKLISDLKSDKIFETVTPLPLVATYTFSFLLIKPRCTYATNTTTQTTVDKR
ncbi:hypothetical protein Avbf_15727 [Armadillidium vulgare]|nr:hypothetical protein Avbf_15727 [Armadillidium vulgare]